MTTQEIFDAMNKNLVFHLATAEDNIPHVRALLLFRADENGIIFHTGTFKELYRQIQKNNNAELCFHDGNKQIRVKGQLEQIHDEALQKEIYSHPTREFLRNWEKQGKNDFEMAIYNLKNPQVTTWTMEENFEETKWVDLA